MRWNFYDLNMMGDVAVSPWHDEPFSPKVEFSIAPSDEMTSMNLLVTGDNGEGLMNFRCTLFNGDDLVGCSYTDENGLASIEFDNISNNYTLLVTGCDAWPQMQSIDLTATQENMMANVHIYPNPNKGQFSINLPEEDCEIVVYNSLGQTVHHSIAKGHTDMNLESLTNGVYFVTVKSENAVSTMKFVKK